MDNNTALVQFRNIVNNWRNRKFGYAEYQRTQTQERTDKAYRIFREKQAIPAYLRDFADMVGEYELAVLTTAPIGMIDPDIHPLLLCASRELPDSATFSESLFFEYKALIFFPEPLVIDGRPFACFSWSAGTLRIREVDGYPGMNSHDIEMNGRPCVIFRLYTLATMDGDDIPFPGGLAPSYDIRVPLDMSLADGEKLNSPNGTEWGATWEKLRIAYVHLSRYVLALLLFCKQRILINGARPFPDRAARRATERDIGEEPIMLTITLRARDYHRDRDSEGNPVDWSCRWLVRGHWRDQHYPSIGENRPIWIAPYVKGPEDKPLIVKERAYNIAR